MIRSMLRLKGLFALTVMLLIGNAAVSSGVSSLAGNLSSVSATDAAYSIQTLDLSDFYSSGFQVQAQNGGAAEDPGVTSDVPVLGLDYSTAVTILAILVGLLVIVVLVLVQIQSQLDKFETTEETGEPKPSGFKQFVNALVTATKPVWSFFGRLNPVLGVLGALGVVFVVLIFNFYNQAQDLGTQIGYAPDQPVNFSHKLHAGKLEIDCQYCHTGVRKAKSANIPSTGICMNCHNVVKNGKYGGKEIQKVVESWEEKDPIQWTRIHNLPDHVYFNHAQHVKAGNVECESCHGNVKNMEVVHQHAKLEMGWCINCHRNQNVDASNDYYQETFDFVDKHDNFTVAEMGGTNCQKCHY